MQKPTWLQKLEYEFNENPSAMIALGALAVTALAKSVDAVSGAKSRRAYAKQINRKHR